MLITRCRESSRFHVVEDVQLFGSAWSWTTLIYYDLHILELMGVSPLDYSCIIERDSIDLTVINYILDVRYFDIVTFLHILVSHLLVLYVYWWISTCHDLCYWNYCELLLYSDIMVLLHCYIIIVTVIVTVTVLFQWSR